MLVCCGLNAVQKIEDGEPLGGQVSAEEAFGGANVYTGGTAGTYQQPQGVQQNYMGYQQPQGVQQNYMGYQQPQGGRQNYLVDPITGRPVPPGGVMGI